MKKIYLMIMLIMVSATNLQSTALIQAIANKNIDKALLLIEESKKSTSQININEFDEGEENFTPLMLACLSQLYDVVTVLLDHPSIEVNLQNKNKITALMLAAGSGNDAIVKKLLEHKSINTSLEDNEGHTALWWGENSKNDQVVKLIGGSSSWCGLI